MHYSGVRSPVSCRMRKRLGNFNVSPLKTHSCALTEKQQTRNTVKISNKSKRN